MGNFSRNTFDQTKNYVAVRLEQGVPLVDADWNELEDVTRFEIYEALLAAAGNVASRGGLTVAPAGAGNDLTVSAGRAVINGRPVRIWAPLRYSTQRYASPATAAADGVVAVTPMPLTPPAGTRTDVVYLDIFEREVTSVEDATLINGAIGIETSTRLKREVIVRVAQGSTTPPAPPAGHSFLPIALLNRNAGPLTAGQIQDVKPYALPLGAREVAFAPFLSPTTFSGSVYGNWALDIVAYPNQLVARKPSAQLTALGIMQLPLPDGARLNQVRLRGFLGTGLLSWRLARSLHAGGSSTLLASDLFFSAGAFDRVLTIPATEPPVANATSSYTLYVYASGTPGVIDIYGGSVRLVP